MVGGGQGAFIGAVHRIAARIDDQYELVAGFFLDPGKKRGLGGGAGRPARYDDYRRWPSARPAAGRDRGRGHRHPPTTCTPRRAREFLKRGIHVICDKPLTATLPEAKKLVKAAEGADALFVLTHNYTGYPMIRQAAP